MIDYILLDGDLVMFNPTFGAAIVVVVPGTLSGSGSDLVGGKAMCIEGDEANVSVAGCSYIAGGFVIPGVGTLKIDALGGDQVAQRTKTDGTPVLLKGTTFTAKFEVQTPAQQPSPPAPPVPDPMPFYSGGTGSFVTMNQIWQGL